MNGWYERDVVIVAPAAAFGARHPRFRSGYAASAGSSGNRPGRIVVWCQEHATKPVVVGLLTVRWGVPKPDLVTIDRVAWPGGGTEARVRAAVLALGDGLGRTPNRPARRAGRRRMI